jgi:hypothetical protein
VFAPLVWIGFAGMIWLMRSVLIAARPIRSGPSAGVSAEPQDCADRHQIRRIWLALGLLLVAGGLAGPDSLGSGHGEFLPQRLALLGLAALVPALDLKLETRCGKAIAACLAVALGLQTAIVWDHALECSKTAGQLMEATDLVGDHQRIATLLIPRRNRFRANSLLHADSWLGVETGNILWSNYETRHYYFPIQFRPGLDRPDPKDFEKIALDSDPSPGPTARRLWSQILSEHGESIDRVLVWGRDARLDPLTTKWGDLESERGEVRVFAPRFRPDTRPAVP